jgi:hydrogenase-4 component F
MWLPDAHSQAPSPVSALLSGALIKCALFGILRFHTITCNACGPEFSQRLLLIFGLISVVVATPFILVQHDLKRLLGYHSVEHVGIIALGLGFGGRLGIYGALLHVINHGVTKALAFLIAGDAISRYGSRDIRNMRGYLGIAPWCGTLLLMAAFSLAGAPPFSIFISELITIRAGIGAGHYGAVSVFLVMMVVIFAGLIHHVGQIVFGVAEQTADRGREARWPLVGMIVLASVMLLLGIHMPASLDHALMRATEVVLG